MITVDITARLARTRVPRPWLAATRLLFGEQEGTKATEAQRSSTHSPTRTFLRHFLEMVAAMVVGMMLLGGAVRIALSVLGESGVYDSVELRSLIMATNMTIGMALWMRHRGHSRREIAEMSAAMFVPLAVLIYPFWAGVLSAGALLGGMHVLMLPAMLGVMLYRRDVYSQHHRGHASTARSHDTSH